MVPLDRKGARLSQSITFHIRKYHSYSPFHSCSWLKKTLIYVTYMFHTYFILFHVMAAITGLGP